MERIDLHNHTCFSDGKNTPEEMVQAAIAGGLNGIGFSDHSYLALDPSWCMAKDAAPTYRETVGALREDYREKIKVFCGIEQDYFSGAAQAGYDYVIGSVHCVPGRNGRYYPVDESALLLRHAVEEGFDGDPYTFAEAYFSLVADVVRQTGATVVGHFDLLQKFCEQDALFDPAHPRYRGAWQAAADRLLQSGVPFEINTGAIARGYRTSPYPAEDIFTYLRQRGARFLLNSDSHSVENLRQSIALRPALEKQYRL